VGQRVLERTFKVDKECGWGRQEDQKGAYKNLKLGTGKRKSYPEKEEEGEEKSSWGNREVTKTEREEPRKKESTGGQRGHLRRTPKWERSI